MMITYETPLNEACKAAQTLTEFLQLRYTQLKSEFRDYSYRDFSRRAGFGSPNYLQLVSTGQRNMSPEALPRFIRGLMLNDAEGKLLVELYVADVVGRANDTAAGHAKIAVQAKAGAA